VAVLLTSHSVVGAVANFLSSAPAVKQYVCCSVWTLLLMSSPLGGDIHVLLQSVQLTDAGSCGTFSHSLSPRVC
jgi:hypothetical protein